MATGNNVYIGARYVPLIAGAWDELAAYEPLTVVLYTDGNSYTSKTYPPIGTLPTDTEYWALTGNYNAQVESYRQTVEALKNSVVYTYETMADMLAATDIPENVCVRTMGYYSENDGGGCLFYITGESLVENNCTIYELQNGYFAKMLIENNQVNIKAIGARSQTLLAKYDIAPYLVLFDTHLAILGIRLYIPSGIWTCTGHTYENTIHIKGDYTFTRYINGGLYGTIITAHTTDQEFVLKFSNSNAGTDHVLTNFTLENIILSNAIYDISGDNYTITGHVNITNAVCVMQGAEFGTIKNIMFAYTNNTNLKLESCNELYFTNTNIRTKENPSTPAVIFKDSNVRSVNSSIHFDFIQLEGMFGSLFYLDDYITNCDFGTIMFEPNQPATSYVRYYCDEAGYDDASAVHVGIFECASTLSIQACHIGNLLLDGFSAYSIVYSGTQYIYDTILSGAQSNNPLFLTISAIDMSFSKKDFYLFKGTSFGGSVSNIDFGILNITTDSSITVTLKPIIDAKYVPKFDIKYGGFPKNNDLMYSNEIYKNTINSKNRDLAILADNTYNVNISDTLSPLKTAIRAITANSGIGVEEQTMSYMHNSNIDKILFRRTQAQSAAGNLKFIQGATVIEIDCTDTVNPIGTWNWFTVNASSLSTLSEGVVGIAYNMAGDSIGAIDCIKIIYA